MRRVLLTGIDECPVVPDASHADASEVTDALRQHVVWLWQALRSLWDAQPLLQDTLVEHRALFNPLVSTVIPFYEYMSFLLLDF